MSTQRHAAPAPRRWHTAPDQGETDGRDGHAGDRECRADDHHAQPVMCLVDVA